MFYYLWACTDPAPIVEKEAPSINLTAALEEDQVRLGIVEEEEALFGGISAEGQIGDYKIYNNRARFIIQSNRISSYYVPYGGGVLDADIARREGEQGRDFVDEHTFMAGLARILRPTSFEIVSDGSDGVAHLRVIGEGAPFEMLEGALENFDIVQEMDMSFQIDYRLHPNSPLLDSKMRVFWNDDPHSIELANVMLIAKEVVDRWYPGSGYNREPANEWIGMIGKKNEVAMALFPSQEPFVNSLVRDLLEDETPAVSGFSAPGIISEGDVWEMHHYIGVGSSISALTDAWYAETGVETELETGTITDSQGQAVAGARVQIMQEGSPITMAITDEQGGWSAQVPVGTETTFVASGRLSGIHTDLPAGAGWYSPYASQLVRTQTLQSMSQGGLTLPFAEGYGLGSEGSSTLQTPGTVSVEIADGLPAVGKLYFLNGDPVSSPLVVGRPHGAACIAYTKDGEISFPVEPGEYNAIVIRGSNYSAHQEQIRVSEGETVVLSVELEKQDLPPNVYSIDSHSHSAPSGDGRVSMSGRVLSHAGHGVDIHVSTEHDHVIDFQPLIDAIGVSDQLDTFVGAEVSPPMRGHFNIFPLEADPEVFNFGAPIWWDQHRDTDELFALIREVLGEDGMLQSNHPTSSSGLFRAASYDLANGKINSPEHWATDFNAVELLNDGHYSSVLPYYFDLISRGYSVTPMGVSDSHSSENGVGVNRTYVYSESKSKPDMSLAMQRSHTVVSRGPYIHATIEEEWAPGRTFSGVQSLKVTTYKQDWMQIDEIILYENGVEKERIPYEDEVLFNLAPLDDAHYSVEIDGATSMRPFYGEAPWAITSAILIDLDGDGWSPPLPPLD
ncbi:MAG: CehA/McbA family metallohydrolase [Myxococcota bacterium]|nr:CehA/McbA family metallohydrolase [Myxococcota bacterium]